jgi:hypothetical protein
MTLSAYYSNITILNETEKGGWATNYYGVLSKVINDNDFKKVAEVGIGYGTHAKYVLKTTNVEKLYLVDPMKYYPNDGFAADVMNQIPEIPENNFNELHNLIQEYLSEYKDRFEWFRQESLSITNEQIPNESLDCVFVDADHSYQAVKNDLDFWWNKVRQGGQILGDDYWMDGVAKAVQEFADKNNLQLDFLYKENSSYKIYRFIKI